METAYYYNTATGERYPTQLPDHSVPNLVTGEGVSKLRGVSWAVRNQCGYYRAIYATADEGFVIIERRWPDRPNGSGIFVERIISTQTQADHDQEIEDAAQKEHDDTAPDQAWTHGSKYERFTLRMLYKLAKLHAPGMTPEQFLAQAKPEWDAVK